mmetsp:Transcript_6088/g.9189  ORF Transcript_6088/g.9189 Transcript_6088/m.9189 type:complete len:258 (-) Transcript_6088:156-929(-)
MLVRFILLLLPVVSAIVNQEEKSKEILELLFPKRETVDKVMQTYENYQQHRKLGLPDRNNPPEGVDDALCVICHGLSHCDILNGLLIQEVYYPEQNADLGTCSIIESLGARMANEIFGIGRTFRDTPQCRDIVMQYLCLFWGSQNDQYTNLCYWKEDVSKPNPEEHKIAPRPPCRSFCVQIAEVCANQADFMDICGFIECPPTEDECTPDPVVGGEVVAAGIGCDIPSLSNPYSAADRTLPSAILGFLLCIASVLLI